MTIPRWVVSEGKIGVLEEEHVTFPPAREVFSAAFHAPEATSDLAQALPDLEFSRFPARPAARLLGSPPLTLRVELGVLTDGNFHVVDAAADQIIADGTWFPIAVDEMEEAVDWLQGLGIDQNGGLSNTLGMAGSSIGGSIRPSAPQFSNCSSRF